MRDIIAQDRLVSIRKAQKAVEQRTEHHMGDKFLSRLMSEVRQEARSCSDKKEIGDRLTEVRERFGLLIKQLNRVAY